MSFATAISPAILTATIAQIALLFLSAGIDQDTARDIVASLLADYNAQSNIELALAADIISFQHRARDMLGQCCDPELPLKTVLRMQGSAISLSREANKAQRRLDRLRKDRLTGDPAPAGTAAGQLAAAQMAAAQLAEAFLAEIERAETQHDDIQPSDAQAAQAGHAAPDERAAAGEPAQAASRATGKNPGKYQPGNYNSSTHAQNLHKQMLVQRINENAKRNQAAVVAVSAVA
jgi:hypothetical protein